MKAVTIPMYFYFTMGMRFTILMTVALLSGCGQPKRVSAEEPLVDIGTRSAGVDWPSFLGPTGDSRSTETGITTPWPKEGPRIVWQRELGISYGIGSVSKGRYFQFDRIKDEAILYCLNAETGEELWKFSYPTSYADLYGYNGGPRCSPVVDGNRVYIFGVEGMLHCLQASDGKLLWKVDTTDKFGVIQNFFGVGSTPVIEGDLLIAIIGGSPKSSQGTPPGRLDLVEGDGSGIVAFDKMTGELKYKVTDELASYASPKLATINGKRWCLAFTRSGLFGISPEDGELMLEYPWRARILESVNASTPVVVNDEVFISETYGPGSSLLKVSEDDHETIWMDGPRVREKAMQAHWNTPIYHEGFLYGCSGRNPPDADLRCIEWKTGKVIWSVPNRIRTSLLYVDGHFVSMGEYGALQLFKANPEKFELVSEALLRGEAEEGDGPVAFGPPRLLKYPCWAAPILSHGLLYVRGKDRLICLELIPDRPEE